MPDYRDIFRQNYAEFYTYFCRYFSRSDKRFHQVLILSYYLKQIVAEIITAKLFLKTSTTFHDYLTAQQQRRRLRRRWHQRCQTARALRCCSRDLIELKASSMKLLNRDFGVAERSKASPLLLLLLLQRGRPWCSSNDDQSTDNELPVNGFHSLSSDNDIDDMTGPSKLDLYRLY